MNRPTHLLRRQSRVHFALENRLTNHILALLVVRHNRIKNGEKPTNKMRCGENRFHTRNRLGLEVSGSDPSPEGCGFKLKLFEILNCVLGLF
jgi:hypothetical protein